jgi:hypothetical protein
MECPINYAWLGIAIGDLVQELHTWHLATALGNLDPIANKHRPAIDSINALHPGKNRLYPAPT